MTPSPSNLFNRSQWGPSTLSTKPTDPDKQRFGHGTWESRPRRGEYSTLVVFKGLHSDVRILFLFPYFYLLRHLTLFHLMNAVVSSVILSS